MAEEAEAATKPQRPLELLAHALVMRLGDQIFGCLWSGMWPGPQDPRV